MSIVYKSDPVRGQRWQALLADKAPERAFHLWPDCGNPDDVCYLVAWQPPDDLTTCFSNLRVLFSIGAGVDQLDLDRIPTDLPIVRMIDPGLTQGMIEYVLFAVLALQRDMPSYLAQQRARVWQPHPQRSAAETRVGVLGVGELGQAVLERLASLGFDCAGWSRSPRPPGAVPVWHGDQALPDFLARTDILVCLLPLTSATRGLLNTAVFDQLPESAALVNVGRGPQLVIDDLLAALDRGHLGAAVLDVVDPEPLPSEHALWAHPRVWLTPHIASAPQPETALDALLANIERFERGEAMHGKIDRTRGY